MYQDKLKTYWNNLCGDFSAEYSRLRLQKSVPAVLNEWYQTRIHRWNSVVYAEGITLDQQNDPEFTRDLNAVLRKFSFMAVEEKDPAPSWLSLPAGLAAGTGITLASRLLLQRSLLISTAAGALIALAAGAGISKSVSDAARKESDRIRNAYAAQLRGWEEELLRVCREHRID